MPYRSPYPRRNPMIVAMPRDGRAQILFDGVIAAGAVVASADGRVAPAERSELIACVQGDTLLSSFGAAEAEAAFDTRVKGFTEPGGVSAAVASLLRLRWIDGARSVLRAAERVAAADGEIGGSEARAVLLVHRTLFPPLKSFATLRLRARYARA